MRDVDILFVHLFVTLIRLARPGGLRSVVAESLLVNHQLLILNRGRKRAPNLRTAERCGAQKPRPIPTTPLTLTHEGWRVRKNEPFMPAGFR